MVSTARLCLMCKGSRKLCGWRVCPLYQRQKILPEISKKLGMDYFGPSTSVFVGHNFYPDVYVGPLAPLETDNVAVIDSPQKWFGLPYGEIIRMRSMVLRSKQRENVHSRSGFVEKSQELVLASKPTDVELGFKKKPVISFEYSDMTQPMGPSATLSRFRITENPKIPRKIDRVVSDDLKAEESAFSLYKNGVELDRITNILSSGILGIGENRKLVPTRWSITATDSMIAGRLMEKVREYSQVNEYMVFESEYLDNHFVILVMPGPWEFENFEAWAPGSTWSAGLKKTEVLEEYEPFGGRSAYAYNQAGGYYAARVSVVESLSEMRKQASVVSFREVSQGYTIPLGVWVVRSTARQAFRNPPVKFQTREEALKYVSSRLRIPISDYLKQSRILGRKSIRDFVK